MRKLDHKTFMNTLTDREKEALIQQPVKFFVHMQNKYVHKNPDLAKQLKEIADEHRRIDREDARIRKSFVDMAEKARKNLAKNGEARVSLWD
jgi:hypothetical protein